VQDNISNSEVALVGEQENVANQEVKSSNSTDMSMSNKIYQHGQCSK